MTIAGINEIVRNAYGLWITALFDAILVPNPTLTFEEHREAFFWLIEMLLRQDRIRFCPPNELWREGYDVWDVDASTIVVYLREHWPASAKAKNDPVLSDFFYAVPAILWVGDDGQITSS